VVISNIEALIILSVNGELKQKHFQLDNVTHMLLAIKHQVRGSVINL